ncbi:hypothetical protein NNO_0835 [Hydrogenimonas sp.]|nr:hypothetical protein NNO_0835 [Hydrogenimonas sp.]
MLGSSSEASQSSVWKEATSLFGSNADRYLYLALPLKVGSDRTLFPLNKGGKHYYVKRASYTIVVKNETSQSTFDVEFGVEKRKLNIRGIKNNLIVDIGEKEVVDISYDVKERGGGREIIHNYFRAFPAMNSVQLFPGFYGSKLFGRFEKAETASSAEYIGFKISDSEKEYIRIDPSCYTDMDAEPYAAGENSLLKKRSLLDYASSHWGLISELRIWNLFHYGIDRPKERRLTGFLKIEFYVKPVADPQSFGNLSLPFSNVWYEVNYKLSSELAKAALLASDNSLVPKRSYFAFKKRSEGLKIDMDIEITVNDIEFAEADWSDIRE